MYSRKIALAAVSAVVLAVGAGSGYAQSTTGALVGTVRDTTGAVVTKASVVAKNTATGVVYTGNSGGAGEYRISNLPNGVYDVTTTIAGFAPSTLKSVAVSANNVQTEDFSLSAAGNSTVVEVSNEAAVAIDTTTAQISQTFSTKEVQDLPTATVGLGVVNLSLLSPGVTSTGGLGAGTGPSVSGQRPRNNNFMIDGVDNNSKSVTGPLLFVPNDATQEFTLLQNIYSAQYGHSTGGQFNTLITSGTNSLHGRLYEYFQNRKLNAVSSTSGINNVAAGMPANFKPRFDFNRYGGQLGGPVFKDRLFLFSNYERQTLGQSGTASYCSPTAAGFATLNGLTFGSGTATNTNNYAVYKNFSQASPTQAVKGTASAATCGGPGTTFAAGSGLASISVNNSAGAPNAVAVGAYGFSVPVFTNQDFSTSSMDYTISQHDSLHARYVYNREDATDTAATFQAFFGPSPTRLHLGNISEIHQFTPNLSNEFRIGYNRLFSQTPVPPVAFAGLAVFPNLVFYDLNSVNLGPDGNAPQATIQNLYQVVNSLTWVKGRHTMVFGGEGRKYISPQVFVQRARGDYEYSTLSLYLNDFSPDGVGQRNATPPGVSQTYYGDQTSIYGYANDDWRVTPTLTFNLGLRYEFTSIPATSKLQSLNNAASVAGLINFNQPKSQKKNFAPRIGVAFAPNANTSVRAAFGINYDVIYDNIGITTAPPQFQVTENVVLTTQTPSFLAGGGLAANATFATLAAQRAATTAFVPDQHVPYSEQWTLGIQHVFHNDYTAEVRYVGTRGVHLDVQEQINVQSPVTTANQLPTLLAGGVTSPQNATGTLAGLRANNANGAPFYRVPAYYAAGLTSAITSDLPIGGSNYNGLQTQVTRRFQKGLLINAAYTYSRNMDDSTADFNTTALNPRRAQDAQNLRNEYAVSDLDRRHRATLVAVYDLPFFKNGNVILRNLLGNYELAPSYTFQSPQLTTPQSITDSNLNNDAAGDRTIINRFGVRGTATGVVAIVNPGISCVGGSSPSGFASGIANGTTAIINACYANIIGYTPGQLVTNPNRTLTNSVPAVSFVPNTTAYYVQAGPGTIANAPRNSLATGRTNNLDLTAVKRISVRERYKLEFQLNALNVLNHSQYLPGSPSQANSLGSTGSRAFDTVSGASSNFNVKEAVFSNNPRSMQLSGKLIF